MSAPSPHIVPGVLVVWSGASPTIRTFRVGEDGIVLGRDLLGATTDDRISRQHARLRWSDGKFTVGDLGSRNGTYAQGQPLVDRELAVTPPAVVRAGRTVALALPDITRFEGATVQARNDGIVGASTAALWHQVDAAAHDGANLVILGDPGTGKGKMARSYAQARGVPDAVFNPTIQAVPLEKIATPKIETLVLEQVGKLGPANTATLVRLLDARPTLRVVTTATLPLESLGMPAPLAARLTERTLRLPPLRDRPDEMAYLIDQAVRTAEPGLQIHSTLIEACLLRPWPGNSRELIAAVQRCAYAVAQQGKNNLRGEDLEDNAGHLMVGAPTLNGQMAVTQHDAFPRKRPNSGAPGGSGGGAGEQ